MFDAEVNSFLRLAGAKRPNRLELMLVGRTHGPMTKTHNLCTRQDLDHNAEPRSTVSFLDSSVSSVIHKYYFLYVLYTSFVLFLYAQ